MDNLLSFLERLRQSNLLKQMNSLVLAAEDESLFDIAFYKHRQKQEKIRYFSGRSLDKCIVITNTTNLGNVSSHIDGKPVTRIEEDVMVQLAVSDPSNFAVLEDALVIMTNNNVAKVGPQQMAHLISQTPRTLYAIHDFDNHHWHDLSVQNACLADIYAPAHMSDYAEAARINPSILFGAPCGTIQWTREFLLERQVDITSSQRSASPLGMHSFYSKFKYRNSVLATVGKHFPEVGLLTKDFHGRTPEDRWNEWVSYELHWIAPVFNDLPIRFFDALVSGGLPLVPTGIVPYLDALRIPPEFYGVYGAADLINCEEFAQKMHEKFLRGGKEGMLHRFLFALDHYHVDAIIKKIWDNARFQYTSTHAN
jgi:hypothetical protein